MIWTDQISEPSDSIPSRLANLRTAGGSSAASSTASASNAMAPMGVLSS